MPAYAFAMELYDYLHTHFLTRPALLAASGISDSRLAEWQQLGLMPLPSYRLEVALRCTSFFGPHEETLSMEFYPSGAPSWIGLLEAGADGRQSFDQRYLAALSGAVVTSPAVPDLDAEWRSFLDGTYGLCTRSGLPEDIALKELGARVINEELALTTVDRERLRHAMALLATHASLFAPHERERSSRDRLLRTGADRLRDWSPPAAGNGA